MVSTTTESKTSYQLDRWAWLKTDNIVEYRFVFMLSPVLEFIYQAILQHIQSLPTAALLLEQFELDAWLRQDLCNIFHPILSRSCVLEMHLAKQAGDLTGDTPEARFNSFIDLLQDSEFVAYFMQKYQVLQNIIDRRVTHYIFALQKFFEHLDQDYKKIAAVLLSSQRPLEVMQFKLHHLSSDGADVHCQGQRVFILEFLDHRKQSHKLVYKPHHLDPEELFNHLIEWFNPYVPESPLRPMKLMNQNDHGWVEFIEHQPCKHLDEVHLFYRRAGQLLAFLYLFNSLDIHYDNIIAHGSYPILIDLECFLTPDLHHVNVTVLDYSLPTVLSTLFLPLRIGSDKTNRGVDMSALGFSGGENWFYKRYGWTAPGTDEMRFARLESQTARSLNLPFLKHSDKIDLANYENDLLQGFESTYFIILNHLDQILSDEKISPALENMRLRLVLKATAEYAQLLMESYHPSLLKDHAAYEKHLDWLRDSAKHKTEDLLLISSELSDLNDGDIPFFSTQANAQQIYNSYLDETGYMTKQSGLDFLLWRMKHVFSKHDCYHQLYFIQMSFELAKMNKHELLKDPITQINHADDNQTTIDLKATTAQALFHTEQILDHLVDLALIETTKISWPDAQFDPEATYPIFHPTCTNSALYSGNLGILLIFLYAHRTIQKPSYEKIIQQCLTSIYTNINAKDTAIWLNNIGVFSGAAGILYVFEHAHTLGYSIDSTMEERLLQRLQHNLAQDKTYDVIGGVAGLVLALCKRQARQASSLVVDLIHQAIHHLLKNYPDPCVLPESFKELYDFSLPGFSHGVAGMAWALWQASSVYSNHETEQWIERALVYIKNVYDKYSYYPDFRSFNNEPLAKNKHYPPAHFWCHGHVGIGFFYNELHHQNSLLVKHAPINHIFKEITQKKTTGNGCLCCGTLGEIAFLWHTYQHDKANMQASEIECLKNMLTHLFHQLSKKQYSDFTIGTDYSINLMQGQAGIAYILLSITGSVNVADLLLLK